MFDFEMKKGVLLGEGVSRIWYTANTEPSEQYPNPVPTMSTLIKFEGGVLYLGGFVEFCKKACDRDVYIKDTIMSDNSKGVKNQLFFKDVGKAGSLEFKRMIDSLVNYPCIIGEAFHTNKKPEVIQEEVYNSVDKVVIYYTDEIQRKFGLQYLSVLNLESYGKGFIIFKMVEAVL